MATKAWVAKQKRREALVAKFADVRRQLKKEKNFAALAKLPRDSQPDALAQPLPAHRPLQGHAAEVQDLPHHAPRAGAGGQDPGTEEGELVSESCQCRAVAVRHGRRATDNWQLTKR